MKRSNAISGLGMLAAATFALLCSQAQALTAHDLASAGMDELFGRYAPKGDCSNGPIIAIDKTGFTYEVAGKKIHPATFEIAYSFWGNSYEGIQIAVFPFVKNDNDYGASNITLNADEVPGKIIFELGEPAIASATEKALAKASPYMRCGGAPAPKPVAEAPPPPPAVPLDWSALPKVAGSFDVPFDMFDKGEIAAALRALIGSRMEALKNNLSVRGAISKQGSIYYISGNAPHLGGEEQAYVLMDAAHKRVQVGLWEKGKLTVYAPPQGRLPIPADIAKLLDQSPSENAVALPGTPWEVIQTSDGQQLATVDAAGSVDIQSFSIFCDQGRPKIAMLLTKPQRDTPVTLTWNFSGRTVNIGMGQGNNEATFWLGWLNGSPLLQMISANSGFAYLRINGVLEGQASLTGSTAALRSALKSCARI